MSRPAVPRPRFEITRTIGSGGMGVVYEAFDSERQAVVAVKILRRVDAVDLFRFKREFRALADISHPNLVTLYELLHLDDDWLFTMELVRGASFIAHVRPRHALGAEPPSERSGDEPTATTAPVDLGSLALRSPAAGPDEARLRPALRQLVEAVSYLHARQQLHRDIKPSNVLVTDAGLVKLCDFGLVVGMGRRKARSVTHSEHVVGTRSYMSPEQAGAEALTEASDWYSVGVMLYEALTGHVPFAAQLDRIVELKRTVEPPPPELVAPSIPRDLAALCVDLLRRDPAARPPGREVLRRAGSPLVPALVASLPLREGPRFIGRRDALARLEDGYYRTIAGEQVTVYVSGVSGMGKTSLVEHFLARRQAEGHALVLAGRCYEREALPYKAVDSLIDALTAHLVSLPAADLEALLPDDIGDLARVFPVMRRVEAIALSSMRRIGRPEPRELRRRAFGALRRLLLALCELRPVIVFIDDLQWGDIDSAALLGELIRAPGAPRLLMLFTYRSEDRPSSLLLASMLDSNAVASASQPVEIELRPLDHAEMTELVDVLSGGAASTDRAALIVREAGGHPLLADALVRHLDRRPAAGGVPQGTVDDMLRARIAALPSDARTLLEVVAAAGRPTSRRTIQTAARLDGDQEATLVLLHAEHLLRSRATPLGDELETFHDRVREVALVQTEPEVVRAHHARIASALQAAGSTDHEALVQHWLAAGERERAAFAAVHAARAATAALAFERAAALYRIALAHPASPEHRHELMAGLGEALANAGRGAEAAPVFQQMAAGAATEGARLELLRRAAFEYLRAGHVDRGSELLGGVMQEYGLNRAASSRRSLVALMINRAYLRLRGLRFRRRDESQIAPETLARIDICWTAATGLGLVDHIHGAEFQARHLLLALRAGEPTRVVRALALEAGFLSIHGSAARARARRIHQVLSPLVEAAARPDLHAMCSASESLLAYQRGAFADTVASCERTIELIRASCTGMVWELATAEVFSLWSRYYLGQLGELGAGVSELMREANARGDRFLGYCVRTGPMAVLPLLADDPGRVVAQVAEADAMWSKAGFQLEHYWGAFALGQQEIYAGDPAAAHQRLEATEEHMRRVFLMRIEFCKAELLHLRGRAAIAAARLAGDRAERRRWVRRAQRDERRLRRIQAPWKDPLGGCLRASIAELRGDEDRAVAELRAAIALLEQRDMHLHRWAAERRLGKLVGGSEGAALVAAACKHLVRQDCRAPERLLAMLCP